MRSTRLRRTISQVLTFVLTFSIFIAVDISQTPAEAAGLSTCADSAGQTSNMTVSASHGQVFYIDSSSSQNLDAAYIGYQVNATAAKSNVWVRIDSFSGGIINLANQDDANFSLGNLTTNTPKTAFFLLKAQAATKAAQTHTVRIYSGKPGTPGAVELRSCSFSFAKVQETIKANANKVTAITTSPATTSNLSLGSTFNVTIDGDTGTIGSGSTPDNDIIWLTPAAKSIWPTQALRLESTVVKFSDTANGVNSCTTEGTCQFTNKLLINNLLTIANGIKNNAKSLNYKATFTFRVIGQSSAAVPVIPISQISSGTQVKHTPVPATALTSLGINSVSVNAAVDKTVASTATINGSNTEFTYTVKVTNNSDTNAITVDKIVDSPSSELSYVSNSANLFTYSSRTGGSASSSTSVNAPATSVGSSESTFNGPFQVPQGGRIELTYKMSAATCSLNSNYSYINSAKAVIGSLSIGSGPSTIPLTSASGTCGSTSVTGVTTTQTLPIEVVTLPATTVANNSATLNSTVDPNGNDGQQISFEYGRTSTLSDATSLNISLTTTGTVPYSVTKDLTGLTSGTIYYFRIKAGGVTGQILSFVTTEPVATPTITTDDATNVTQTGGTLNATIDPNQTDAYVAFTYKRGDNNLSSGATTTRVFDDLTTTYNASTNPFSVFSGAFPTQVSLSTTDLAFEIKPLNANDVIYYQAHYTNSSGTIISSGVVKSFKLTSYVSQSITFNSITDKFINSGDLTLSPSTSAPGLTVTLESSSPSICTVSGFVVTYLSSGDCTLVASQGGGQGSNSTYYSAAEPVSRTFTVLKVSQTVSFTSTAPGSATLGGSTYNVTGSATSGLSAAITSATPSVCEISAGVVSFVGTGTCTLNINQAGNATYLPATQVQQSFSVDYGDRTLSASTTGQNNDTWGTNGRAVSATASADDNDSKTFTPTDSTVCSVDSNGYLTLHKPGTCELTASIARGNRYKAKTASPVSFTVAKKALSLTGISDQSVNVSSQTFSMAADDDADSNSTGITITYSISGTDTNSANCTVNSSGLVSFTSSGECSVVATTTGNDYWSSATVKKKLTVNSKANRSLTLSTSSPTTVTWDVTGKSVSASPSANDTGDVKSYQSDDTDVCTVDSSGNLIFKKAGHCVITAEVSEGPNYNRAVSNSITFTVQHVNRSLNMSANNSSLMWTATPPTATVTSTATADDVADGSTKRYSTSDSAICSVNATTGVVTFTSVGDCRIVGTISQGAKYNSATSSSFTVRMNHGNRTLNMNSPSSSSLTWSSTPPTATVSATASDDDVTDDSLKRYSTTDSSICSVDSVTGVVTFVTAGDCRVHASISRGSKFDAADTSQGTPATISMSRASRTVTLSSHSSYIWSDNAPTISVTASSDNSDSKTFSSVSSSGNSDTSVCTVDSNGQVSFVAPGTCYVKGTVQQGPRYNSANGTTSFTVLKRDQTLAFDNQTIALSIGSQTLTSSTNALVFNSGVSGSATYSLVSLSDDPNSANCSISSRTLSFTNIGSCKVKVEWSGNSHWNAAEKTATFTITGTTPTPSAAPTATSSPSVQVSNTPTPTPSTSPTRQNRNNNQAQGINRITPSATPTLLSSPSPRPNGIIPGQTRPVPAVSIPAVPGLTRITNPPTPEPSLGVTTSPASTRTIDLGQGVKTEQEIQATAPTITSTAGQRTLEEISSEKLSGFAPGVGTRIEVIGARTGARFVIADNSQLDAVTMLTAIQNSIPAQRQDFTQIQQVSETLTPSIPQSWTTKDREFATEIFAASGLSQPILLSDLLTEQYSQWLRIESTARTYLPGSIVYLTITSKPLVLGTAVVDKNGEVKVTGDLPVEWLETGEHKIRIVGIRSLDGVSVDEAGEVQLAQETLDEIQKFDLGTQATITVVGQNSLGGEHAALRIVPLNPVAPWWTLWILLAVTLTSLYLQRKEKLDNKRKQLIATGAVIASGLPAIILGWLSTVTLVTWVGLGATIVAVLLIQLSRIKPKKKHG